MEGEGTSTSTFEESFSELEAEYEIVEHEQAHATAVAKASRERRLLEEERDENRWGGRSPDPGSLAEPFLDSFAGMINRQNLESLLKEQRHM